LSSVANPVEVTALWTERSGALGEVLAQQSVGFSLVPALQGACGSQKIDVDSAATLTSPRHPLRALVPGQ